MTRRPAAGFILVSVLMIMLVLAGLVGAVAVVIRGAVGTVRSEVAALQGDAILRAGLELGAYQLVVLRLLPADIDGQQVRLDGGVATLFARSDAGRVDLNAAAPELLERLYKASGLKRIRPEEFAARVVDWRDEDDESLATGGSEADAFRDAGLPQRPANAPFASVDELLWIGGIDARDLARLEPLVTVHNPAGTVNLFDAPEEVLRVLGLRPPDIRRILAMRRTRDDDTAIRLLEMAIDLDEMVSADVEPVPVYRLTVEARPEGLGARSLEAVVARDPSGRDAFRVLDWIEPAPPRPVAAVRPKAPQP